VLSADAETDDHGVHPLRVLQAAHEAEPVPPGSVIARPGPPLRLLAVVTTSAGPELAGGVGRRGARRVCWREARVRRLRALAVPVLGRATAGLPSTRFAALLRSALRERRAAEPRTAVAAGEPRLVETWSRSCVPATAAVVSCGGVPGRDPARSAAAPGCRGAARSGASER